MHVQCNSTVHTLYINGCQIDTVSAHIQHNRHTADQKPGQPVDTRIVRQLLDLSATDQDNNYCVNTSMENFPRFLEIKFEDAYHDFHK